MNKTLSICAALFLVVALVGNVSGQNADLKDQAMPGNNRFENGAVQAARTKEALESVEKAIAVLIPGGIADGSPRKEKFAAVIDSFIKRQSRDAMDALEKMAAEDPGLPPAEIMMAGLTFAVGDNKSGIALLENSAIKHPDYPGVYLSFAQLAINTNRITDASLHAEKTARLIEAGNLTPQQKSHFLKQYYEVATSIYMRRKQNDQASKTLDQLQAITPNLPFYFFSKAELAFRAGDNDLALRYLKQHAGATKSKRLPELTLVDWLKNTGKSQPAEELLLKTREQNPKNATAQMMAAQMYMSREDFPNSLLAIKQFEEINNGESPQSLDMKGRIAFAGLSYDVAAEHFRDLTIKAPNDPSNANILALCLVESNDPQKQKEAVQISQRVASRMSNNPLAVASLAYILMKNGEKENSKQLMQRIAMSRQTTPEVSYFVANWLIQNGQPDQAAGILKQTIDVKGLFLYRSAARKLLSSLQKEKQ